MSLQKLQYRKHLFINKQCHITQLPNFVYVHLKQLYLMFTELVSRNMGANEHETVGQPAWQESSKVKSQSRDFRFIFDEKWRSTLRLKYVGLQ
jgi:hypothetical protein